MALAPHSTGAIAQSLSGIDFPANKSKLVDWARKNNADREVISVLEYARGAVHEHGRRLQGRRHERKLKPGKASGGDQSGSAGRIHAFSGSSGSSIGERGGRGRAACR